MTTMTALVIILLAAACIALLALASVFRSQRRRAICPETGGRVVVTIDPKHTLKALFSGQHLKVTDCERWPERQGCDRKCEENLHA